MQSMSVVSITKPLRAVRGPGTHRHGSSCRCSPCARPPVSPSSAPGSAPSSSCSSRTASTDTISIACRVGALRCRTPSSASCSAPGSGAGSAGWCGLTSSLTRSLVLSRSFCSRAKRHVSRRLSRSAQDRCGQAGSKASHRAQGVGPKGRGSRVCHFWLGLQFA